MKIKGFISNTIFIVGMLLSAIGIVILEVLNFRKATAYDPGFDIGVWVSIAGIVIMAASFAVDLLFGKFTGKEDKP